MSELHLHGCCCAGCLGLPQESTSDSDTPTPPGSGGATKPIYTTSQIRSALTTADGQYSSVGWAGQTITYSIGTGPLTVGQPYWESEYNGYVAMSAGMEAVARDAFGLWDEVIAVDLVELANTPAANISFNYTSASNNGTYAEYGYSRTPIPGRASNTLYDSDLWFADSWWTHDQESDLVPGGYGILTYLHEIGHALGLSHPGPYNGSAGYGSNATHFQDTRAYTVMSYFNAHENGSGTDHIGTAGRSYGATPLLHDIMVLQEIYGADMTTRTGGTVYGFNTNTDRVAFDFSINTNPVIAIWDAGGIDKIDASGWNTNQRIDLTEGAFSSVGHLTDNVAIAYGVTIELATTGGGNDVILGNSANNVLTGNGGNDTLTGLDGADIFYGGSGADLIDGGDGQDWARYNVSTASVAVNLLTGMGTGGEAAGDVLISIEHVYGSQHDDDLTGDHATANRLYGNGGDDDIYGGGGHDFLLGQDGDDRIYGGTGRDVIRGGAGADLLDGGSEDDWVQYNDGGFVHVDLFNGTGSHNEAEGDVLVSIENVRGSNFNDVILGSAGRNIILAGAGDDIVNTNGGNDVVHGEEGEDQLIGSNAAETFYGGEGADVVDGGGGNDWIRYTDATAGVSVSLLDGEGFDGAATDQLINLEFLWGSDFDDDLAGDDGVNMIRGGAGDDTITGHGGNDILQGYDGADQFVFAVDDGIDRINAFDLTADRIRFVDVTGFGDLVISDFRGSASITYDTGDVVLLTGIDSQSVTSGMFLFG
ncbi:MAG: M10 family metallopeptidase C-terminal domain-containing protein [Pseudomonadota bacterium]